jgi:hypothetical protein
LSSNWSQSSTCATTWTLVPWDIRCNTGADRSGFDRIFANSGKLT